VGKNGQNNPEDVLFVTWCLYKLSKWQGTQPDLVRKLKDVGITRDCTGRDGDRVVEGIKALQLTYGTLLDGRVSPVPRNSGHYGGRGGGGTYLILYPLNALLAQMHPAQWPRIDLMPEFIWTIKDKAMAPFTW
jgi:hypothetical protein